MCSHLETLEGKHPLIFFLLYASQIVCLGEKNFFFHIFQNNAKDLFVLPSKIFIGQSVGRMALVSKIL